MVASFRLAATRHFVTAERLTTVENHYMELFPIPKLKMSPGTVYNWLGKTQQWYRMAHTFMLSRSMAPTARASTDSRAVIIPQAELQMSYLFRGRYSCATRLRAATLRMGKLSTLPQARDLNFLDRQIDSAGCAFILSRIRRFSDNSFQRLVDQKM